jgi:hypothetical protein
MLTWENSQGWEQGYKGWRLMRACARCSNPVRKQDEEIYIFDQGAEGGLQVGMAELAGKYIQHKNPPGCPVQQAQP